MAELLTLENAAALLTLTVMEVVLGIDNIVFIAILAEKLPPEKQAKARRVGLVLAMLMRILLLLAITWIMSLKDELFRVLGHPFSGRDLIMLVGGGFLIYKATHEIHDKLEGSKETITQPKGTASFKSIIAQIVALDIVFSLDSVITAVGMVSQGGKAAKPQAGEAATGAAEAATAAAASTTAAVAPMWHSLAIMITAVIVSVAVMLIFAGPISGFIKRHPTTKMLALSFLLLIGVVLVADGFGQHVNKGYIYAAMAFSVFVELLNLRVTKKAHA